MRDFLGQEVSTGDEVVVIEKKYRNLIKGRIISIAPKSVLVSYKRLIGSDFHYRVTSEQFVKVGGGKE